MVFWCLDINESPQNIEWNPYDPSVTFEIELIRNTFTLPNLINIFNIFGLGNFFGANNDSV